MLIPSKDCALCPRLKAYREQNKIKYPDKFNAPVPSFGPLDASFLITGLAPGLKGANFTGRPFTGDYAGDLLYQSLIKYGFASGEYRACLNDGLVLNNCRISNSVKCVPPANKPTREEKETCRRFFESEINEMKNLKVILALGKIAHDSVLKVFNLTLSQNSFGHGNEHQIDKNISLIDSYHCSRYNTQTGRLTYEMFEEVISRCRKKISA